MRDFVLTKIKGLYMGFIIEDKQINEIRCYEDDSLLGNIYLARVSNILLNINAGFVDIEKNLSCYLSLEDLPQGETIKKDDRILVQISKDGIKTKQPTVTKNITFSGNYVVVSLYGQSGVSNKITDQDERKRLKGLLNNEYGYSLIARTAAEGIDDNTIKMEINKLCNKLYEIVHRSQCAVLYSKLYEAEKKYAKDIQFFINAKDFRVITDREEIASKDENIIFYKDESIPLTSFYNINRTLEKTLSNRAYLKSGAYLVIEPTEAMTVVDVNSGKAIKGKDAAEIMYKINLEAAKELARQLRLRNLSGIVVVDFISMKSEEHDKKLMEYLSEELKKDYVPTKLVDITKLGLVEITRKKINRPIHEINKKNNLT